MKKSIIILFAVFLVLPSPASAHVLKSDGAIGVLFHVDPDDDPYVGQPANLHFQIKDKDNKFALADCNCTVSILKQGNQIFSSSLNSLDAKTSIYSAGVSYTFTEKAVYTVVLKGSPKASGAFQPFSVQYDVRISRELGPSANNSANPGSWLIVAGFVVLAVIAGIFIFWKKK
jgi:hypothetical protein